MSQIMRDAAAGDLEFAAGEDLIVHNGELLFKVVAVGCAGAADWVSRIHAALPPDARGELTALTHDAWTVRLCKFPLAGVEVHGYPVRVYLMGHEGIGFFGQPGGAKDVVYKRANAILGLADPADVGDLVAVLGPDLVRHRRGGGRPLCLVVSPEPIASPGAPFDGAEALRMDWRARPQDLFDRVMTHVLTAARAHRPPGPAAASAPAPTPDPPPPVPAPAAPAGEARNAKAARLVATNFEQVQFAALSEPWELLYSPIWEPGPNGKVVRRVFLAPRSMRAHYFDGAAREFLRRPDVGDIVIAMSNRRQGDDPRHPKADLRQLYCDPEAPYHELSETWTPALGGLSLLLADCARRTRVGATVEQLMANELTPEQSAQLDAIEEAYRTAVIEAPEDELQQALLALRPAEVARPRTKRTEPEAPPRPAKPWWKIW